jgi:hypothetical protein
MSQDGLPVGKLGRDDRVADRVLRLRLGSPLELPELGIVFEIVAAGRDV